MISIIIPTYNSELYIKEAIDSVINQTYKDKEIIVIDDGSTDNTKKILQPYIKKNKIIYIKQKNAGQAAARNTGIKKSKGEFLAFLDSDDIWLKNKLETQIKLFNKKTGLVHGGVEWFSNNQRINLFRPSLKGKVFDKLIIFNPITTSTVIVRKKALPPFNESMDFHGTEDYDAWLRISKNWKINCTKEIVTRYRIHPNNISLNLEKRYRNEINVKKQFFPEMKKSLIKNTLWNTNFNTAYNALNSNKNLFKKHIKNCIHLQPFNIKNYKLLGKSWLK